MTLYTRLVLTVSVLLVLTTAALSYALIRSATADVVNTSRRDLEAVAELLAYSSAFAGDVSGQMEGVVGEHMVAEALLTAHLVRVAEGPAGLPPEEISAMLTEIADQSAVDEFWITDERGHAYLTNTGQDFTFSPNPLQQPQMYVFWELLEGETNTLIQEVRPHERTSELFKYAAVSGIDQPRIVQVGYSADFLQEVARNVVMQRLVDRLTGQADIAFIRVINENNTTFVTSSQPLEGYNRNISDREWQLLGDARTLNQPRSELLGDVLVAAAPVVGADGQPSGSVLVYQTTERLESTANAAATRGLGLTALALAVGMIASLGLARSLSRPVQQLGQAAEALARGEWQQPDMRPSHIVELNALSHAFRSMGDQLQESYQELEGKVSRRTVELAERADQLHLINHVGRSATFMLDAAVLLPEIAQRIQNTFDYYAVLILLVDDPAEEIRLSAAATEQAAALLEHGLTLSLGQGIIGHVARTGEALVVGDVSQEPRFHADERLRLVRSELALPLRIGEQVIGVLDLQSIELNAFDAQDVQVLQTLADQLAVAVRNAQLFHTTQAARQEAESANHLKSKFLANMSHELRTPLNAIINFSEFILSRTFGELTERQQTLQQRILANGEHLLGLINDILDLSKIEAGRMELVCEEVELRTLLEGVRATAVGLTKDKGVEVLVDLPEALPAVWADRVRVRQVLLNLLSNSAKFTREGTITIWAREQGDGYMAISVSDTGIGIPLEEQEKVFEEFHQVQGGFNREYQGTGLGLPICKRMIEMHGGELTLTHSAPGVGSTFTFTLPSAEWRGDTPVLSALGEMPVAPTTSQGLVVVVDDDPDAQAIFQHALEAAGWKVHTVSDSRQAVTEIQRLRPHLVLLDIQMPYLDGWAVLNQLRQEPSLSHIPVMICSIVDPSQAQVGVLQGVKSWLVKPIMRQELLEQVERYARAPARVLIVDDDPDAR
ncbi:MAG: GAF domain-containing protein, partial [Ardenticatenales bacterium]|nr:GAF domain-containing protein [Ardenticatenales bacterium]